MATSSRIESALIASTSFADTWLADYKKAGGDGFLFNSEVGQEVEPVK